MAVQLTFDKCREIFKTLADLKLQGNRKIYYKVADKAITVGTENATARPGYAVLEAVTPSAIATSYDRDLHRFRALITMKMYECVKAQLDQPAEKKLGARIVTELSQEINSAIEGLKKLKEEYKTEPEKSRLIEQIISEDFQPLVNQMNPSIAGMSGSVSSARYSELPIPAAALPAEVACLRAEMDELKEQIIQLRTQLSSQVSPSSFKKDTFLVILIVLNIIVIGIQVFNFIQEG